MLRNPGACSAFAILSAASAAFAQASAATPSHDPAASHDAVEEVVVTATKNARAESLQRVPVSITAVNMKTLDDAQITNIMDVARLAPNVQFGEVGSYVGYPNFTIRGIGINSSVRTVDPAVGVVVDGMPLAFPIGLILDTFDIGSIEILRGPQGVLQGRNSTGGAVTIQTRKPSNEFGLETSFVAGNGGRFDWTGLIEGPIHSDALRGKIAIAHRSLEGLHKQTPGQTIPSRFNPSGKMPPLGPNQQQQDDWIFRPIQARFHSHRGIYQVARRRPFLT
jgi:iron complex outermembrane receptor protein